MKTSNAQRQMTGKGTFIKYLNPSTLIQPKANRNRLEVSNIHCRSMQELDFNANAASHSSMTRQNLKTNIHHSSLFSDKDSVRPEQEASKSKSLSKFITFFENSNLLNPNQIKKESKDVKRNNYNGFSYDLKISANSNAANNKKILKKKDKENINYQTLSSQRELATINPNKSTLAFRNQNCSPNKNTGNQTQQLLLAKMKEVIEEQKRRQQKYCEKIQQLQEKNRDILTQKQRYASQVQSLTKKLSQYEERIKEVQAKCRQIHEKNKHLVSRQNKNSHKENRQQDMVVKSLKKVINEQLNKIIELERFKIQNEYLKQRLGHQVDQNQSESSFSNHDYSFDYEHKDEKKSLSASSFKPESQSHSVSDYGKQNFMKSKPKKLSNQSEQQNAKSNHFKSFFQISQSPISGDDHMKRFFTIPENNQHHQGRKESNKFSDKNQGSNMIKIIEAESSFSRQAIEQVNEQNDENEYSVKKQMRKTHSIKSRSHQEQQDIKEAQDSILQEVDQYLSLWRNNKP